MKAFLSPNRFIPNDYEELTALELIGKQNAKIDETVEQTNVNTDEVNKKLNRVDYYDDIVKNRKISESGNFTGSWFGISSPSYAEPGIADVVEQVFNNYNNIKENYEVIPQSPRPPKQGLMETSYKLIYKKGENEYKVVQKANKKYIIYTIKKTTGGSSSNDSGESWELTRIQRVNVAVDTAVWWWSEPVEGSVITSIAPTTTVNSQIDGKLLNTDGVVDSEILMKEGMGLYDINVSSSASWNIPSSHQSKLTVLLDVNSITSSNVEIYVNDEMVKTLNTQKLGSGSSSTRHAVNIEIPVPYTHRRINKITLKNLDTTRKLKLFGFNFSSLMDYEGLSVNQFKVYGTNIDFINSVGANDYAFYNVNTKKWVGSFHGGETLDYAKCTYQSQNDGNPLIEDKQLSSIPVGTFWLLKNFEFYQRTKLLGQTKMTTIFNFDIDGTVEMKFGMSENNIKTSYFYTALTCTSPLFTHLYYPYYESVLDNVNTSSLYTINNAIDGMISQYDVNNKLELISRYTQFNNYHSPLGNQIWCSSNYNKHYYGVIRGFNEGITINKLSWSKGLDFIIH